MDDTWKWITTFWLCCFPKEATHEAATQKLGLQCWRKWMHWESEAWRRAGTFYWDKNTLQLGLGNPQSVVIYGLQCNTRALINWEAHKCRISILSNRITAKWLSELSFFNGRPWLVPQAAFPPRWSQFTQSHWAVSKILPLNTARISLQTKLVFLLPTKTFYISQSFFP